MAEEKILRRRCCYSKYEPVRFGVETGVMIGGMTHCQSDAMVGSSYCAIHDAEMEAAQPTEAGEETDAER